MKITKLQSMGGSGNHTAQRPLDNRIAPTAPAVETTVAEIRRDLVQWLEETHASAESVPVSLALLETAFDRYLATYNPPDAFELIEAVFRRAVRKRRGLLQ
jgi:hypothetical protein